MDFKERIFQARKAKGFSQEDLAELIGVSRQAVSKWETGEAMPDTEKLIALCNALDQNIEYLALGKEAVMPKKAFPGLKPRIAILLAVVCLAAGILIGSSLSHPISESNTVTGISISNAISDAILAVRPDGNIAIAVLPVTTLEDLKIELLCEDKLLNITKTIPCIADGDYYWATLFPSNSYHWDITAVFTYNDNKIQIPLYEIEGEGLIFNATHRWKLWK